MYVAALAADREQIVQERLAFFEAEVPLLAGLPLPLLRRVASAADETVRA